jgi:[ribosomal protein S5]-alanine N-acetyltransferase
VTPRAISGYASGMAVMDWLVQEPSLTLSGESVTLRAPRMADYADWAELRRASREFLQPWEPTWPADDLTRGAFRRRLSIYNRDFDLGQGYAFLVFRSHDDALVGGINLRDVRRGVSQSAAVGYWIGQSHARRGYTLDAARTLVRFALNTLGLHRIEAACCPENDASSRLLRRAGFQEEGLARAYLKINGVWRDHLLFGLVRGDEPDEDPRPYDG